MSNWIKQFVQKYLRTFFWIAACVFVNAKCYREVL